MVRIGLAVLLITLSGRAAEIRKLTLKQAVDLALEQNPDLALARLDEKNAEQAIRLAKDPFVPKVVVGSGLAYSSGFPMSIEGATPSVFQARAISDVFNRQQSYKIASAKESRRGAAVDTQAKRDDVAYRTAELFLDAERNTKAADSTRHQIENLQRVAEVISARITEGRELPIENKRAALNLAKARYRLQSLETALSALQSALAGVVGLDSAETVQVALEERTPPPVPLTENAAVETALSGSKELRALESRLLAKTMDARGERAARYPKLDLVAQYGLLARFNNYEDFFRKFQRNNGQLGISFQVPIWSGPGVNAAATQAETEAAKLRVQIRTTRNRIAADTRRAFQEIKQSEAALEVARLDLDLARDQVSILLAQNQEGRAGLPQIEEARFAEAEKWIAFYDAGATLEKSRLTLLRYTGSLLASLR